MIALGNASLTSLLDGCDEHYEAALGQHRTWCGITLDHVPLITIIADVLSGLGSGMTIKFFPLYFNKKLGLDPVFTNAIYVVLPIVLVLAAFLAQRLSRSLGRIPTILVFTCIGTCALGGMAAVGHYWDPDTAWRMAIPLYFLSTAQHCCRPLKKSILMDYVSKETRARWNSLDSVTRFGWSGSAIIGGVILKYTNDDYGVSFLVTAVLQMLAGIVFIPLWFVLPRAGAELERALSVDACGKAALSDFSGSGASPRDILQKMRPRELSGQEYFLSSVKVSLGMESKSPMLNPERIISIDKSLLSSSLPGKLTLPEAEFSQIPGATGGPYRRLSSDALGTT